MNTNQPRPRFNPYANTYNLGWRSHPNFLWRNNQAPIQNAIPNPMCNNDQSRKSTLEEILNTFILFSMDNHERHNKRLDSLEISMKRVKTQVGQIAVQLQGHQKGKLPSQLEQAMAITVHKESKGIDNGVKEIPADNMSLHSEIKGEDIEEPKDEISTPESSKIDQEREQLPLPSLHKKVNPYRPPIPPTCHSKEDHKDKPLNMKDLRSFMMNISIRG